MVKGGTIFLILLLIIVAIGVLILPTYGIWSDIAKNDCIMEQFAMLRSMEFAVKRAEESGSVNPNYQFKVMYCIDCMWYDTSNSQLMIKISEQGELVPFKIETNFIGIGCDCSNCNEPIIDIDDDGEDENCANLRKDTTYVFEITGEYAKLRGIATDDEPEGEFSSQPCGPCASYDEECGEMDSEIITCCRGLECEEHPSPLKRVDWFGKWIGNSAKSWTDRICLRSLREECSDYTECSIFQISLAGIKAQYPCHTIGDDPTNRCCYPLGLNVEFREFGTTDPAAECSGYGGCKVYCGNVKCGYVYDYPGIEMDLKKFSNMCCKPLGEECWTEDWQCCAHELCLDNDEDDKCDSQPVQCAENDGDPCLSGSTNCRCCITPGYTCSYETRNNCCSPSLCRDIFLGNCNPGDECKCTIV